jgi:putative membrane-bound dehydrogenase-like protein
MRNRIDRKSIRGFIGIGLLAITSAAAGRPAIAQPLRSEPLPPDQAIGTLEVMPGLRVELVAHEPQVVDPVSATFDHLGRLWVVEMRDYPSGPPEGQPPSGKIKVLTDRDGDGYFETAVVFADGLVFPTGLTPFRDGVVATLAGQVTYLADTTGDGVCDRREVWFTGFSEDNEQLRANHPTWTLENEIHVASGLRGGEIRTDSPRWHQKEQAISLANRDFCFSPFGGDWRSVAGNSQFGFFQDDAGRNYVCSNRNPCDLLLGEADQVGFNPLLPAPQWKVNVMPEAEASAVYPLVQAWTTSNLHAGQFTAACGVYRYQSDLLAPLVGDNYFACEPTGSLVQR